jgi:hypothetical protein
VRVLINVLDLDVLTVEFNGIGAVSGLKLCGDTSRTLSPNVNSPGVETREPTMIPTSSPSLDNKSSFSDNLIVSVLAVTHS